MYVIQNRIISLGICCCKLLSLNASLAHFTTSFAFVRRANKNKAGIDLVCNLLSTCIFIVCTCLFYQQQNVSISAVFLLFNPRVQRLDCYNKVLMRKYKDICKDMFVKNAQWDTVG